MILTQNDIMATTSSSCARGFLVAREFSAQLNRVSEILDQPLYLCFVCAMCDRVQTEADNGVLRPSRRGSSWLLDGRPAD